MATSVVLTIKSEKSKTDLDNRLRADEIKDKEVGRELHKFVREIVAGIHRGVIDVQTASAAPVAASATLTLTSAVATDAVTIGAVTLTASSTPANENQWEIDGADDAADATSLAAAINAHSTLSQVVTASAASSVVTVTCKSKGVIGNQIAISSADATIVASGTHLSGGTGGVTNAAKTYSFGL